MKGFTKDKLTKHQSQHNKETNIIHKQKTRVRSKNNVVYYCTYTRLSTTEDKCDTILTMKHRETRM